MSNIKEETVQDEAPCTKIVFFGDSITESGRNHMDENDLGVGYVKIAAGKLRLLYPDTRFCFVNRGNGGERTAELAARVEKDVVAEKPDYVVLEVGINDVWCRFSRGEEVTPEAFRANYEKLTDAILSTGAKLYLIQPYALKMGDKQRFRPFLNRFNDIIREIAREKNLTLIPVDEIFTGVTQDIDPAQFSTDGVHPTHRGCRYIADLLIKELKKCLG